MQREIERHAFKMGGGDYTAPAQKVGDFMNNLASSSLGSVKPTCPTGVRLTNLRSLLPAKLRKQYSSTAENDKMLPLCFKDLFSQHPKREAHHPAIIRTLFHQFSTFTHWRGAISSQSCLPLTYPLPLYAHSELKAKRKKKKCSFIDTIPILYDKYFNFSETYLFVRPYSPFCAKCSNTFQI